MQRRTILDLIALHDLVRAGKLARRDALRLRQRRAIGSAVDSSSGPNAAATGTCPVLAQVDRDQIQVPSCVAAKLVNRLEDLDEDLLSHVLLRPSAPACGHEPIHAIAVELDELVERPLSRATSRSMNRCSSGSRSDKVADRSGSPETGRRFLSTPSRSGGSGEADPLHPLLSAPAHLTRACGGAARRSRGTPRTSSMSRTNARPGRAKAPAERRQGLRGVGACRPKRRWRRDDPLRSN